MNSHSDMDRNECRFTTIIDYVKLVEETFDVDLKGKLKIYVTMPKRLILAERNECSVNTNGFGQVSRSSS